MYILEHTSPGEIMFCAGWRHVNSSRGRCIDDRLPRGVDRHRDAPTAAAVLPMAVSRCRCCSGNIQTSFVRTCHLSSRARKHAQDARRTDRARPASPRQRFKVHMYDSLHRCNRCSYGKLTLDATQLDSPNTSITPAFIFASLRAWCHLFFSLRL